MQGAHHILGPFGADSDLRRWGLRLAERGGKNGSLLTCMYAKQPVDLIAQAVFIHPTVSELIPTMLQEMKPLE